VQATGRSAFQALARVLLGDLEHGDARGGDGGSLAGFFGRYKCLCEDVAGGRGDAEDICDGYADADGRLLLALVGMIGQFGLTSKETVYTAAAYSYTYVKGAAVPATTVTFKKPPLPRPWCEMVAHADVAAWCAFELFRECGAGAAWVLSGVSEAVERFSFHNSFAYLGLMPFVKKHFGAPDIYDNSHHASVRVFPHSSE
jgi:hypothetical protein